MVLTRNGNLIPVCGWGKAKVDSSDFTVSEGGIVQKGGKIFSDLWGHTCKMSRLGSYDRGVVYFEQHLLEPENKIFPGGSIEQGWDICVCVGLRFPKSGYINDARQNKA